MIDVDIQELANLTAGDADVENFERLFTKLKEMKGTHTYIWHTVMAKFIGTLCKYDQRRLWKFISIIYPFDIFLQILTKI